MVRLASAIAAAALAATVADETISITMAVPPVGSAAAITGSVSGVDGLTYSNYKVAVLVSADGGNTWWDKSHAPYFLHYQQDPSYDAGDAQQAAVVMQPNWSWTLQNYEASPNDATSDLWVAMLVPQAFDMKWPDYQIEGIQMPASLPEAAIAYVQVSKTRGNVASGAGGCACGGPGVPNPALADNPGTGSTVAPSPAASPAASPAGTPASTPAATPSGAASVSASPAASVSSGATPSSTGSATASVTPSASTAAAGTGGGNNNQLPGSSSSPAPGTSTLPASSPSTAAAGGSGNVTSSGAAGTHGGLIAAAAAVAAGAVAVLLA